jgi:multidomain signaling protein FimX
MAKVDNLVRIVLIEDAVEDAEHAISQLRNAGMAVRPTRAIDADQLRAALEGPQDLIFHSARAKKIGLKDVAEIVHKTGKDIPILAVVDALSQDNLLAVLRDGARSVLIRGVTDYFQMMTQRHFNDLQTRRAPAGKRAARERKAL